MRPSVGWSTRCPGSDLVTTHATNDFMPPDTAANVNAADAATRVWFQFRSQPEFARFLDGLEMLLPGIVSVADRRADGEPQPRPSAAETAVYARSHGSS
jgi:hypothetical protein